MARQVLFEHQTDTGQVIRIVKGDLTAEPVDAIVNAANERLAHGGGVAGAIVRQGGQVIQAESDEWVQAHGPVRTGTAAITSAGTLPARYVIHAVGPVWGSGDEEKKLAGAVRSALALAAEGDIRSISLPAISSGIFGFPKELCAQVMIGTVTDYLAGNPAGVVREVNLCNIDEQTANIFLDEARRQIETSTGGR
jgi:O-acetyl-ADP-ribose deacetylase (regulator of RNase III)